VGCRFVQDFAASVREHVKNTGTKPVQADLLGWGFWQYHEKKNPRPAATETGIKSHIKAISFRGLYSIEQDLGATIRTLSSSLDEARP
jgi:hypothetical protein